MKLWETRREKGRRRGYLFGRRVFSVPGWSRDDRYDRLWLRRLNGLSDDEVRFMLEVQFERKTGRRLDLDRPRTFNEKLQWLKWRHHDPLLAKCADKVGMRDYVRAELGEDYLVPLLGVWDSPDRIDFGTLPGKFVLKVNWGSGQNVICTDRSRLDVPVVRARLAEWMKPWGNHYYDYFEWCYRDIVPRIVAEPYLGAADVLPLDYKFMCYNGEPRNMFIVADRAAGRGAMTCTFFDMDFRRLPFERRYAASAAPLERPAFWDEMIDAARRLARPFPFVRVDFYVVGGRLKVGELTFYPGNGTETFDPPEWDRRLGDMLELPEGRHG